MLNQTSNEHNVMQFLKPILIVGDENKANFLDKLAQCQDSFVCVATRKETLAQVGEMGCDAQYFRPNQLSGEASEFNWLSFCQSQSIDFCKLRKEKISICLDLTQSDRENDFSALGNLLFVLAIHQVKNLRRGKTIYLFIDELEKLDAIANLQINVRHGKHGARLIVANCLSEQSILT